MVRMIHRPGSWAKAITKRLGSFAAAHHNKLQFFGYEAANLVLIAHESKRQDGLYNGLTFETWAALALLAGSACIWRFDFDTRPSALLFGGLFLTAGGLLLVAAGYSITGFAVALASLETARGGLCTLREHIESKSAANRRAAPSALVSTRLGSMVLGWYVILVRCLTSRHERLGVFINERPFLTGTIVKAPMRLEFVLKKALEGDFVAVGVGLSWMILGDGGLAFNDAKLKAIVLEYSLSPGYERDRPFAKKHHREAGSPHEDEDSQRGQKLRQPEGSSR